MLKYQDRLYWIDLLKTIAALLITNSHCQNIYPISYLAFGGTFGNALFFIISGYLLVNINTNFCLWYSKRINKILPATLICLIVNFVLFYNLDVINICFKKHLSYIFDLFWFVWAILIYYVIYYFVIKQVLKKQTIQPIIILLSIWVIGYILLFSINLHLKTNTFFVELSGFDFFKVYYYFGIFIIGALFRLLQPKISFNRYFALLVVFLGVCLWALVYSMIFIYNQCYSIQFLVHFGVLLFSFFAMIFFSQLHIKKIAIVNLLAISTLEIYLLQITFIKVSQSFVFPVNWLCHFSIALIGGVLYHYLLSKMLKKCAK